VNAPCRQVKPRATPVKQISRWLNWQICQHRRCEIFVAYETKRPKAPFRSDIIEICRPTGARAVAFGLWPNCRATGSTLQQLMSGKSRRANFQGDGGRFSGFVAARRQTAANYPAFSDGGALPRRRYANPGARRKRR